MLHLHFFSFERNVRARDCGRVIVRVNVRLSVCENPVRTFHQNVRTYSRTNVSGSQRHRVEHASTASLVDVNKVCVLRVAASTPHAGNAPTHVPSYATIGTLC